jgi:hypothetical protein
MGVVRYCDRCHRESADLDSPCAHCATRAEALRQWWADVWLWEDGGIGPGWFWVAIAAVAWLYLHR